MASLIGAITLYLGRSTRSLSKLKRVLHLDQLTRPDSARLRYYLLPLTLELLSNLFIALAFTAWPGFRSTMSVWSLAMLLMLRSRIEGTFAVTAFFIVVQLTLAPVPLPAGAQRAAVTATAAPPFNPMTNLLPPHFVDPSGLPASSLHMAADLAVWAAMACVTAYVYLEGRARGYYVPEVWETLPPKVQEMYILAGLMVLFVAGLLVVVAWQVRCVFEHWTPEAAEQAERAFTSGSVGTGAANNAAETDRLLSAAQSEDDQGPIKNDNKNSQPSRILLGIRAVLALLFSLGAFMLPLGVWSGFAFYMQGR